MAPRGSLHRAWAQITVAALIVVGRAVTVWRTGAVVTPDSERYRNVADPLAPFEAWHGHGPGVLAQLVFLFPADLAATVQTLLAGACWGIAAAYLSSAVARTTWSWVTFAAVMAWSLSPWFLVWDDWLLTEALTCGGCALAGVGLGSWARGRSGGVTVAIAGVAVAVLTRPFVGALLVPLLLLVAIASVAAVPYSYTPEPESLAAVQATDRLAGRGDVPGYLDLAREHGMPACPAAESIVTGQGTVFDRVVDLRAVDNCPKLDAWLDDGGLPWQLEFTSNTANTLLELTSSEHWIDGAFGGYALDSPRTLQLREWSRTRWPAVRGTVNVLMLASSAALVVAALLLGRPRRSLVATATAWTTMFVVASLGVDGMEYWRHILPAFPTLALFCLAVLLPGPETTKAAPPSKTEDGAERCAGEPSVAAKGASGQR